MENYSPQESVFSDTISVTGYGDPVHPDYVNPAPKQLLQNDLVLKRMLEEGEEIEVNLTNSNDFYFNNSAKTVALSAMRSTTDYRVDTEIQGNTINVGDIVVYDKQMNGFKIAYTGSAASVTVKCYVSGGAA